MIKLNKKESIKKLITDLSCKKIEAEYINSLIEKGISEAYLKESYCDNFLANKGMLSNKRILLENYFKGYKEGESQELSRARFEAFNDNCAKEILRHNGRKLMRQISNMKHLFSEDGRTENLFITLAELGVNKKFVKDNIQEKINAIKTPKELNSLLSKHIEDFGNWNIHFQLEKIKGNNCHILSTSNNKIIFEVEDFESSKNMGSDAWCITREQDSFDMYRKDVERIVFCFDLNSSVESNACKTAFIVNAQGEASSGYFKDDTFMEKEEYCMLDEYFDKYNFEDFECRLDSKGLQEEEKFFVYLTNGFTEEIDDYMVNNLDFTYFDSQYYYDFLQKRNYGAMSTLIQKYDDVLFQNNGKLLEMTLGDLTNGNYDNKEVNDCLIELIKNEKLFNVAKKNKYSCLFEDAFSAISLIGGKSNKEMLDVFLKQSQQTIPDLLDSVKYINQDDLLLLSNYPHIAYELKSNHIETCCRMLMSQTSYLKSLDFLNIDTDDYALLNELKIKLKDEKYKDLVVKTDLAVKLSKIDSSLKTDLAVKLSKIDSSFLEIAHSLMVEEVKMSPRKLLTINRKLEESGYKFNEDDTYNVLSQFVFLKSKKEVIESQNEDLCDFLFCFNIAKPFKKAVFSSPALNGKAVVSFIEDLDKIVNQAKNDGSDILKTLEENVQEIKNLTPSLPLVKNVNKIRKI